MNTAAVAKKGTASIRIDMDLLNAAKQAAKAENRSLSNYIETLLLNLGFGKAKEKEEEYVDEELMKDIERSRKSMEEGRGVLCNTKEDIIKHLERL